MAIFGKSKQEPTQPQPPGAGHSMFGGEHQQATSAQAQGDMPNQLHNLSRRLRLLEERYENLRKKIQAGEQQDLKEKKELEKNMKAFSAELTDYRRDFYDLRDKVRLIVKELKACAKSEDVKILQNYFNLWDPVKFVTEDRIEQLIEEKLEEIGLHKAGLPMPK